MPLRPFRSAVALIVAFLVLVPAEASDDGPMLLESSVSEQLMEAGRASLFDFRLDEAEAHFTELMERPDGQVAGNFHLALTTLYRGLITDDETYFQAFDERYNALNAALQEAPDSRWRTYLEGEARFLRAIAHVKLNRNIRAAMAARSAYSRFRRAADSEEPFYEPYKGLGVFHIVFGSLPSGYQRILSLLGYSGTIEEGLAELREAAEQSRFNDVEARAMLALFDVVVNDEPERGAEQLEALHEAYPESPFFSYLFAYALIENREASRAEELSREAVERSSQPAYFFIDYAEYYLAEALFLQNRFEEAEIYYRHYLARHQGPALRASANFRLAVSLEMQGRREDAEVFYERVHAERDYDADLYAERHAGRYLEAPLGLEEQERLLARNAFHAGEDEAAAERFDAILSGSAAGETARAEARFYLGRIAFEEERYREARPRFEEVLLEPGNALFGYAPWSHYYLGRIHQAERRFEEARAAYDEALAFGGPFDYHQWLEQVVASAREEMDAEV